MINHTSKVSVCEVCFRNFPTQLSLVQHFVENHQNILNPPKQNANDVQKKRRDDTANKSKETKAKLSYACPECGKEWPTPSHVERHMTVHTKQKSYQCPRCHKLFSRKDNLRTHMNKTMKCKLKDNDEGMPYLT
ncbi:Zinc finger, C2H2 domain-containing protein [Rozella allomycis CSF55]|uniref:Zinc finger, C2H2 domain-containing protein n=1 Tax=Rozella allomycis (strain CSF55) TaxID=988480 RepID=A0A075AZH6_ROZAC|nr:Zinc finger, C2H2 domain-containing protein [Rozella allomycis CSF55]|eukprot:EPZ33989.1 Zinc finger, C2H2 domain-containing protein [Rozella allomycis CSF55]